MNFNYNLTHMLKYFLKKIPCTYIIKLFYIFIQLQTTIYDKFHDFYKIILKVLQTVSPLIFFLKKN